MCGIAISLSSDNVKKDHFSKNCLRILHHRGPDGQGIWGDENVSLVHTRLSILELSDAGKQPMRSASGRYVISFNGEIYNHLDLRARFLRDVRFRGDSDTETLLALYEKLGVDMFQYLVGMWAFGIWDTVEKTLIVSRDRYGQKPLYYRKTKDALLFSSEIQPLLNKEAGNELNPLAVSEYLALGNYNHLGKNTFYESVFQILPAQYVKYDHTGQLCTEVIYWKVEEIPYKDRLRFDKKQSVFFKNLIMSAVESQLLADVPVGATLSGGLDSSIIVSCIAELGLKNFPVFTAQFPGSKHDETQYVQAVKKRLGSAIELIQAPVHKLSLQLDLERVLLEQEEPFGDPSIMAHGFLVQAAKRAGVPVLLSGQGGDEVSMGYSWMYERAFAYGLNHWDIAALLRFGIQSKTPFSVLLRLVMAGLSPSGEHNLRMLMRSRQKKWLSLKYRLPSPGEAFGRVTRFNDIYLESLKTVGIPHLCHYDDRSTMALSIEGRMPFLDHRILEYTSTLRPDAFYSNGYSKMIFRKAFEGILPEEILQRKDKVGFHTPLIALLRADLDWVINKVKNDLALKWISAKSRDRLIKLLYQNKISLKDASQLFRLLCLMIGFAEDKNTHPGDEF
ncbi:asparagine synthase (glutamine-hydrolyzing) [Flammeovirgaceae bacterium]